MDDSSLDAFAAAERLTIPAQTKLTPTESNALDEFVEWCRSQGLDSVTRSSAIRTFVATGLRGFAAELSEDRESLPG